MKHITEVINSIIAWLRDAEINRNVLLETPLKTPMGPQAWLRTAVSKCWAAFLKSELEISAVLYSILVQCGLVPVIDIIEYHSICCEWPESTANFVVSVKCLALYRLKGGHYV